MPLAPASPDAGGEEDGGGDWLGGLIGWVGRGVVIGWVSHGEGRGGEREG